MIHKVGTGSPTLSPEALQWEVSCRQAASYCATAAVLPALSTDAEPLPAYTVPAVPGPVSLNAAPGALLAWPGSTGAVLVPQLNPAVVPGCPVVGLCCATAAPAGTITTPVHRAARKRARRMAITWG